jgi:hypothetical protein
MRPTLALEALRASKYRLGRLIIGGRRVNSSWIAAMQRVQRRQMAARPCLNFPGVSYSFMSLACGHAHLNSGITTA